MERKKTLLEKYEIPLNHLDFGYVASCTDAREMEKIVQILRSGEEGYYPDLTKCAEDKLRELRPNSRLFRYEEQIRSRDALSPNEWKPIYDWTHDIKTKDSKLAAAAEKSAELLGLSVPAVRKGGSIKQNKEQRELTTSESNTSDSTAAKSKERIRSTDYRKWDKYDPDEEILRMELAEERVQEEVERKNRLNLQKSRPPPKICELQSDSTMEQELLMKLTDVEREKLAEEYRLRGNEYFRAKEFRNALSEYDRAIRLSPETAAAAHNNRAATNMKMQKYAAAIEDCQQCLALEPNNIKARLRLAQATYSSGRKRESYELYQNVLELDPQNTLALKAITELRTQLGDLPPPTATRLRIHEDTPSTSKGAKKPSSTAPVPSKSGTATATEKQKNKPKEYDLADLVMPNRVTKNKLATAAEALSNLRANNTPKQSKEKLLAAPAAPTGASLQPELRLPTTTSKSASNKTLIEEI